MNPDPNVGYQGDRIFNYPPGWVQRADQLAKKKAKPGDWMSHLSARLIRKLNKYKQQSPDE